jgi:putative transposase
LHFSKQAFYQWRGNPVSQRDWDDAHLTNAAWDAHRDDPAFGYRFISDELNQAGLKAGENRVWRLCSQQRLWSLFAKKRGLRGKAGPPVHDDHVQRNFTATRPNQLWLIDITEHRTAWIYADEGKIYLCAIKDVYSNKIVGYSIDSRMKAPGGRCGPQRDRATRHRRHDSALRSWLSIPLQRLRAGVEEQRHHRVDGTSRRVRR